jgi:hypothetical protein
MKDDALWRYSWRVSGGPSVLRSDAKQNPMAWLTPQLHRQNTAVKRVKMTFPTPRQSGLLGFGGGLAGEGSKITAAFQQDVGSGHTHPGHRQTITRTPSKLRLPARAVPSGIDTKSISGSPTSAQAAANRLSPSRPGSRRVLPYLLART